MPDLVKFGTRLGDRYVHWHWVSQGIANIGISPTFVSVGPMSSAYQVP